MSASDHLQPRQFKVKITPAQSNLLSAHKGGSGHLDTAVEHGATWNSTSLTIPHEAAPHVAGFLSHRASITRDNVTFGDASSEERAEHRTTMGLHKRVTEAMGGDSG